jgi:hypothetical protein
MTLTLRSGRAIPDVEVDACAACGEQILDIVQARRLDAARKRRQRSGNRV